MFLNILPFMKKWLSYNFHIWKLYDNHFIVCMSLPGITIGGPGRDMQTPSNIAKIAPTPTTAILLISEGPCSVSLSFWSVFDGLVLSDNSVVIMFSEEFCSIFRNWQTVFSDTFIYQLKLPAWWDLPKYNNYFLVNINQSNKNCV